MSNRNLCFISAIFIASYMAPSYSCSMDMITASSLVIQEIIKTVDNENQHSDREISKIQKAKLNNVPYWTYIVETSKEGTACQAVGYSVDIDPSCRVTVKHLTKNFSCQ